MDFYNDCSIEKITIECFSSFIETTLTIGNPSFLQNQLVEVGRRSFLCLM